jgi:hypothetical protein
MRPEPIVVSLRRRRLRRTSAKPGSLDVQVAKIAVTEKGFEPDKIRWRARVLARLNVVRTTTNMRDRGMAPPRRTSNGRCP